MEVEELMDFKVVLEFDKDEDCWVTYVPALGNISTWGKTREDAIKNTEEAIIGYLEAAGKEGLPVSPEKLIEITEMKVSI